MSKLLKVFVGVSLLLIVYVISQYWRDANIVEDSGDDLNVERGMVEYENANSYEASSQEAKSSDDSVNDDSVNDVSSDADESHFSEKEIFDSSEDGSESLIENTENLVDDSISQNDETDGFKFVHIPEFVKQASETYLKGKYKEERDTDYAGFDRETLEYRGANGDRRAWWELQHRAKDDGNRKLYNHYSLQALIYGDSRRAEKGAGLMPHIVDGKFNLKRLSYHLLAIRMGRVRIIHRLKFVSPIDQDGWRFSADKSFKMFERLKAERAKRGLEPFDGYLGVEVVRFIKEDENFSTFIPLLESCGILFTEDSIVSVPLN